MLILITYTQMADPFGVCESEEEEVPLIVLNKGTGTCHIVADNEQPFCTVSYLYFSMCISSIFFVLVGCVRVCVFVLCVQICRESFEKFYDHKAENWMYRNTCKVCANAFVLSFFRSFVFSFSRYLVAAINVFFVLF